MEGDSSERDCLRVSTSRRADSRSKPVGRDGAGSCAPFHSRGRSSDETEEADASEHCEASEE